MTLGNENAFAKDPKIIKAIELVFMVAAVKGMDCSEASIWHLASVKTDLHSALFTAFYALQSK